MMLEYILQLLSTALTEGSIYALMALGLVITIRSTEVLFFAQGTLAMVGGIAMYSLFGQMQLPLLVAIPVSLFVCVVVVLLVQCTVILPLLKRGVSPFNVSIITIGVSWILEAVTIMIFGKDPLPVPFFSGDDPVKILGANISPQHFWIIGFTLIALLFVVLFFKKTRIGKAMTALGDNHILAKASGFPVVRLFTYSFIFAALVGGLAGIVAAPVSYTGYFVGFRYTIKGFVAAAVGGISNPLGALVGGLIVGFLETFTSGFISSSLKDIITMIFLLLILKLRPQGLLGGGR
jgi:branched-chain amino acid transport system permease protein